MAVTTEDEYFPPPRHLRELLDTLELFASVGLGADPGASSAYDDRAVAASRVLAALD